MLAWLVVAKFVRHLPVYRHQEMLLGPLKLWLSRHSFVRAACERRPKRCGRWRRGFASMFWPAPCLQVDETPVRFLGKLLGRAALGYIWAYAGDKEHPYVFYDFQPVSQPGRSREDPADVRGLPADRRLRGLHGLGPRLEGPHARRGVFCSRPPQVR